MKNFNYYLSVLRDTISKHNSIVIRKTSEAYTFFVNECPDLYSKDNNGNLLIYNTANKRTADVTAKMTPSLRIISRNFDLYPYFESEYRQNTPSRDNNGNYILPDEIVKIKTKKK